MSSSHPQPVSTGVVVVGLGVVDVTRLPQTNGSISPLGVTLHFPFLALTKTTIDSESQLSFHFSIPFFFVPPHFALISPSPLRSNSVQADSTTSEAAQLHSSPSFVVVESVVDHGVDDGVVGVVVVTVVLVDGVGGR